MVVVCALAALPVSASAETEPVATAPTAAFVVGIADDHSKWLARPDGLLAKYRDLGLDAVRVTIPWRRGRTRPKKVVATYLHRAAQMVARGQRVVVAVFGKPSEAPIDARGRKQYCDFLQHFLVRVPFQDVVIWNEANSPTFWPKSAGARAYEALLATCWKRLHAARPNINVISTTAAHHDPGGFLREMGAAYRERGRKHPILDTFGHNPYPDNASEPPWVRHDDSRTVGQGDLDRLLRAADDAFEGTSQPVPGQRRTTVWYLETGFQTTVPITKRRYYRGVETDRLVVPPLAGKNADPAVRDQARQLRDALFLAYCQPAVGALFNFELLDEDRLEGWQSGVLWRDGTHKASYEPFKAAVELVASGAVDCTKVRGAGPDLQPAEGPASAPDE